MAQHTRLDHRSCNALLRNFYCILNVKRTLIAIQVYRTNDYFVEIVRAIITMLRYVGKKKEGKENQW